MMELYEYFHWAYEDRGEGLDLLAAPGKDLTMDLVGQVVYAFTHVLGNLGENEIHGNSEIMQNMKLEKI